jgi:hypothetical protein
MMQEDRVVTVDQDLGVVARKRNLGHAHMSVESALDSGDSKIRLKCASDQLQNFIGY